MCTHTCIHTFPHVYIHTCMHAYTCTHKYSVIKMLVELKDKLPKESSFKKKAAIFFFLLCSVIYKVPSHKDPHIFITTL